MSTLVTLVFLAALAATTLLRLWLARRHMRHIAGHRDAVPAEFVSSAMASTQARPMTSPVLPIARQG